MQARMDMKQGVPVGIKNQESGIRNGIRNRESPIANRSSPGGPARVAQDLDAGRRRGLQEDLHPARRAEGDVARARGGDGAVRLRRFFSLAAAGQALLLDASSRARIDPARGAPARLVAVPAPGVDPLFVLREDELEAALDAGQRPVLRHEPTMAVPRPLFKMARTAASRYNNGTGVCPYPGKER
jgi:hypothetical protein